MVKNRLIVALLPLLLMALSVVSASAGGWQPPPPVIEGPTSLETSVTASGGNGQVSGTLDITNVGEYPGVISRIRLVVEERVDREWVAVGSHTLGGFVIPASATRTVSFSFTYVERPGAKSHRLVSYVTLVNHPTGERTFVSRASF